MSKALLFYLVLEWCVKHLERYGASEDFVEWLRRWMDIIWRELDRKDIVYLSNR
jgi:hypothetical protein